MNMYAILYKILYMNMYAIQDTLHEHVLYVWYTRYIT